MLNELRKKINTFFYSQNHSNELKSRVKKEIEIIGEDKLIYLLKIKDILEKNYEHSYSISGSINSFYIAYYLDITCFNPVKYGVFNDTKVTVSINIPENEKDNLFNIISKELPFIKKVSTNSNDTNTNFNGFVFDYDNYLSIFDTGIVKAKKKDLVHKYFVVNIYEKEILSLLKNMYYGNDNILDFFNEEEVIKLKKMMDKNLKHKTPFEEIIGKINKIDFKELIKNNVFFDIRHIDQLILEYKLNLFKYHLKRTYYITYLTYLSSKVDVNIVLKYRDNFLLFFNENKDIFTTHYKFYSLWSDARDIGECLNDLKITVVNKKIKIIFTNINHIYTHSNKEKFSKILEIISKNTDKEIDIFGYEGNSEYYLSNIIAEHLGIHSFQVASYLNPLSGGKVFFDSDFYKKIDEEKYLNVINYYRNLPIFLHAEWDGREELQYILSATDSGTEVIIIDNYEELIKHSKYSKKKINEVLNKLNKEVIIFHKIQEE